jgi:hypothetical protein
MLRSLSLISALSLLALAPAGQAQSCSFLMPIGGTGSTTAIRRIGPPKVSPLGIVLGRTNWNTDFAVN